MNQNVSKKTKALLFEAERKNPDKITVVVENGDPEEEEITNFKQVKVNDITKAVLGIKENKMENNIKEVENKNEKQFVSVFVFNNNFKKLTSKKTGKTFYKVRLTHDKDGNKLNTKGTYYYVLLNGNRLAKSQKDDVKWSRFWVFADEKLTLFRDKYIEDEESWINGEKLKEIDAITFKKSLGNKVD